LFPGGIYHVTARGNDRQTIFADQRSGHVFQGRYGGQLVAGRAYLPEVWRYIVLNPGVTGAGSATAAARSYVRFVEAGIDEIRTGATAAEPVTRPCPGDAETRDRLAQSCEAAARDTQIPRAERYATRPSLATLFPHSSKASAHEPSATPGRRAPSVTTVTR
jgi:hypothetical protein